MIPVVHIITKLELGGAQENTLYTCRHLDRSRFEVMLWHGPDGMLDDEAASIADAEVSSIPTLVREVRPHLDAACTRDFIARLRRFAGRQVIVHTHSSKAGIIGRAAARLAGAGPVVHTIHGFSFHEGQAPMLRAGYVNAERAAARYTDAFIGVSRSNLAEARARGIITSRHEVELIRSGFDLDAFAAAAKANGPPLRRELGLGDDDEVIVSIANMKPQKDPHTLVEAMRQLVLRRKKVVLLYAGDGVLRSEIEVAISKAGLTDRFRLLGWRRDVPALMGAADVVVLSSIFEGLPRVSVQALAARRPFVGTRVDGTPEIIRDGRNGFLVEPRDPTGLANALDRALDERPVDPDDIARIQPWQAEEMVRAQERLYMRLIARTS